ncbi:FMN-binding protein [Bathymodiolus platifrons methanotrophic gill symbiont]|uniref:FMN-binding protein n=1 Tax=Bathymodiolus platifrons methanotrophic gill symbiont TaxID=113268 RepID=UPI00157D4D36|nr:FMN-binding protein [Bathymodiolus platifrons methanotrophic gill symbiont]
MKFLKSCYLLLFLILSLAMAIPAYAKIYYSKQEAMELAFGSEATVEMMSLFLTDSDVEKIQQLARVKVDSALFTFYVGKKAGELIGYAAIETHKVRTKPETLLIVLNAQGQLTQVQTLAFHEPPEYQPSQRWYAQMFNLPLEDISFRAKIQGISGATLSSRSAIDSVRKVLAVYQTLKIRET